MFCGRLALPFRTEPAMHGTQTYYVQVALSKRFSAFVRTVTARMRVSETLRFAFASVVLVTIAVYFTLRRVLKPLRATSVAARQASMRVTYRSDCRRKIFRSNSFQWSKRSISRSIGWKRISWRARSINFCIWPKRARLRITCSSQLT